MARTKTLGGSIRMIGLVLFVGAILFASILVASLLYGRFVPGNTDASWVWALATIGLGVLLLALIWVYREREVRQSVLNDARAALFLLGPTALFVIFGSAAFVTIIGLPYLDRQPLTRPAEIVWAIIVALEFLLVALPPSFLDLFRRLGQTRFSLPSIELIKVRRVLKGLFPGSPKRRPVRDVWPEPAADGKSPLVKFTPLFVRGATGGKEFDVSFHIQSPEGTCLGEVGVNQRLEGRTDVLEVWLFNQSAVETQTLALLSQTASVDESLLDEYRRYQVTTHVAEHDEVYSLTVDNLEARVSITEMETDGETFHRLQFKIEIFVK